MLGNQHLLEQLQQMLNWKKSKKYYAEKLGITENEVNDLLKEIRSGINNEAEAASYIEELEEAIIRFQEDVVKGTGEVVFNSPEEIRSLEDLIEKCKIDTNKWEVTKYVQNYWGNSEQPHWQVKAWLGKKSTEQEFQDSFIDFLEGYKPLSPIVITPAYQPDKPNGCLIINKQDSHFNKLDIEGYNNVEDRFNSFVKKVEIITNQAQLSNNLEEIYYIIGSDEFNSEFTGTTTKGTPQQNIMNYHESFSKICDHEVEVITLLLTKCEFLHVIYVPGNHDEFVGWHMVKWLKTYFRNTDRLIIDDAPNYRKYISYGETAMMFNHGDAIKPAKLAALFPMEYRDEWSWHTNFYIFTGDKHHELSQDFNGIKFYQIPAFSNAKSSWDDKNGYTTSKAEVTAFLVDFDQGMTNIFKQYL